MLKLRAAAVTTATAAALAAAAFTATPASAATVRPNAGWIGTCYYSRSSSNAGGWCDGNGPDWRYQGVVYCSNGYYYLGVVHWAGDRRGSYAYCPSGTHSTAGGLDIYYDSTYQWSDYL